MPACLAASISSVPGGAVTGLPSMVRVTVVAVVVSAMKLPGEPLLSRGNGAFLIWARAELHVLVELVPELLQDTDRRHGGSVAQGTQGLAQDVVRNVQRRIGVASDAGAAVEALEQ